jgi:hypothetical protein
LGVPLKLRGLRAAGIWLPIGLLVFSFSTSFGIVNPLNIAWLERGDMAAHFMGWHFFRKSDWGFPIGLNPNYGLELGSSIVFSDSIPLLALLFKPFDTFLPATFQYFGMWLLLCFVLQAFFAQKLITLMTSDYRIQIPGVLLLALAPIMIERSKVHLSLSGHFLVLAALYVCLRVGTSSRRVWWCLLLCCAASVHAYILVMVLAIWFADVSGRYFQGQIEAREAVIEVFFLFCLLAIVTWQIGYFVVGSGVFEDGYGYFRMNLMAPFDAYGWSHILKSQMSGGDYEGFSFPGLGVWLAAIFASPAMLKKSLGRGHFPPARRNALAVVLFGMLIYAISNKVGFGHHTFEIPLPDSVVELASVFRASGRFSWPVVYVCTLAVIWGIVRVYPRAAAIALLSVFGLIQVMDTGAQFRYLQQLNAAPPSASWSDELTTPFWSTAAERYTKLRWLPTENKSESWKRLAMVAAKHGLATDAVYVSRIPPESLVLERQTAAFTKTQGWETDTLYVMSHDTGRRISLLADPSRHLIAEVEGLTVLAPEWWACNDCSQMKTDRPTKPPGI